MIVISCLQNIYILDIEFLFVVLAIFLKHQLPKPFKNPLMIQQTLNDSSNDLTHL